MIGHSAKIGEMGFTLIELLVVLTIAALGLTIASAYLSSDGAARDHSLHAARIAGALRIARAHAHAYHLDISFTIDPSKHEWHLEGGPSAQGQVPTSQQLSLEGTQIGRGKDEVRLVFYPDGSASGGRISLSSAAGTTVLTVRWLDAAISTEQVRK